MNSDWIKLKLLGVTFSQVQTGAYALILAEEEGLRRVPIIVGTPEAQSIAIFLEGLTPPRPLTHDLFISFTDVANIEFKAVHIHKYDDGVFYSSILFERLDGTEFQLDSRTSDAIALAIRSNAPIYITKEIMEKVSVVLDNDRVLFEDIDSDIPEEEDALDASDKAQAYELMTLEELKTEMNTAIANEDYEKASHIRDIINQRTS